MSDLVDPILPQSAPLPGTADAGPSQPQQADQAAVPGEPQPDAGTPAEVESGVGRREQDSNSVLPTPTPSSTQPDQWTVTDTPADAPSEDETVQPADSESAQE